MKMTTPAGKQGATRRRRGEGNMVALTVRVTRDDWMRMHKVAISEGVSLQELAVRGISRELQNLGHEPLSKPSVG